MKTERFWRLAGVTAALAIMTLGLLVLNLMVQPSEPVHGADPGLTGDLTLAVLPIDGTPEPAHDTGLALSVAPAAAGVPDGGTLSPPVLTISDPQGGGDGTCAMPLTISCGGQESDDTSHYANNHGSYSSGWPETGPEVIYRFTLAAGTNYTITAEITHAQGIDLDVYLLSDCDAGQCLVDGLEGMASFGNTVAEAANVAPGDYYIAVDGYNDTRGAFTLKLTCTPPNRPPDEPSNPDPVDGATGVGLTPDLRWTGGDPDGDPVLYTVEGSAEGSGLVIWYQDITVTACQVGPLDPNTRYAWKVTAKDMRGGVRVGPIWGFMTGSDNQPPNEPSGPSPRDGATGVSLSPDLSWTGGDPDIGDTVVDTIYGDLASSVTSDLWCATTGRKPRCRPPGVLQPNTRYTWQVVASDQKQVRQGTFWEFTTGARVYVPVITRKLAASAALPPGTTPSPTPTATSTPTPTPTTPPTAPPPPALQSVTRFVNHTPYVIVSLRIDGTEWYPTKPMGLLPDYYVDMDLGVGDHRLDAYNGWWQDDGSRFTMYWWQAEFPQQAGTMTEVNFEGPAIGLLLPDFGTGHRWQGEYWAGGIVTLHYADFCFYDNNSFRFYLDGLEDDTGTYEELYRTPGSVTFRATNALGTESFDGVLNELDGSFMMGNGPSDWRLIQYYPNTLACPPSP